MQENIMPVEIILIEKTLANFNEILKFFNINVCFYFLFFFLSMNFNMKYYYQINMFRFATLYTLMKFVY